MGSIIKVNNDKYNVVHAFTPVYSSGSIGFVTCSTSLPCHIKYYYFTATTYSRYQSRFQARSPLDLSIIWYSYIHTFVVPKAARRQYPCSALEYFSGKPNTILTCHSNVFFVFFVFLYPTVRTIICLTVPELHLLVPPINISIIIFIKSSSPSMSTYLWFSIKH